MIGWAKEDLAKGKLTPEQANKLFEELGATPEQRAGDQRTDAAKEVDLLHGRPADPAEYLISYARPGQDVPMTPEIRSFDASARTWMSEAGLPRELGNSLVNQIDRVTEHTKAMTPEQLIAYGESEFVKLQNLYGATLNEKLLAAARMVQELDAKKPGLKNLLKSQGIGDNAMVASMLIQHGERYGARKGR
jgi:hypothetical protein